jgi:hypothetical protein
MPNVKCTHQLVVMRQPYLVIGPGFEVPTGVPRALKKPDAPLWWQREGQGTAFRIAPWASFPGWFAVSVWWAMSERDLPPVPDEPVATGCNTVSLEPPTEGIFPLHGSHSDGMPVMIEFDEPVVSYSWAIRIPQEPPWGYDRSAQAVETLTIVFGKSTKALS